jgi:hypothetical protein
MNHASAIKFIKDHKDTPRFAILPIDEKTFPQLKMIRKFGKDNTYELVLQGLYEMFQLNGFDKAADISTSPFAYDIKCAARNFLGPIYDRVIPQFTEDEEITAWNLFVNESEFMKVFYDKAKDKGLFEMLGLDYHEWMAATLRIRNNSYDNIKEVFGKEMDEFVKNNIGKDSEYYFGDKWFVCIKEKAYSDNTPEDMVNTLLNKCFKDKELRDKIFNEWHDWMYEHHDYITGRAGNK